MRDKARCTDLGRVEPVFPVLALARDVTRKLRFVVYAAGWLHCMVLHGRGVEAGEAIR